MAYSIFCFRGSMLCHNSSFMYLKTATLKPLQSLTREGNWNFFNRQFQILYLFFFPWMDGWLLFLFSLIQLKLVYSWHTFMVCSLCCCLLCWFIKPPEISAWFFCKVCFWMSVFFWGFWFCLCTVTRTYCNVFALSKFLDFLSCIAVPILSWNILAIHGRTVKTVDLDARILVQLSWKWGLFLPSLSRE